MTYSEAQMALVALGHSLSITGLEGRSLSQLLTVILLNQTVADVCVGSILDESIRVALGITA